MDPSSPPGRQPEPIRLSRVGGGERRAGPAIVALLLLLAVAVIKPWAAPGSDPEGGPATPPAAVAATSAPAHGEHERDGSPSAGLTVPALPDPVDATRCLAPQGWRLVTYEVSLQREVRSWIVVAPVAATGPLDPAIVPLAIVSDDLLGVGLCAPGVGPQALTWDLVAPRLAGLWRLTGGTGTGPTAAATFLEPVPLDPLAPPTPPVAAASGLPLPPAGQSGPPGSFDIYDGYLTSVAAGRFAFLYTGPRPSASRPASPGGGVAALPAAGATWPPGRYVAVVLEPGTGTALWFGFALTSPAARGSSASSPRP